MGVPVPFRTKKGEIYSHWKAVIPGKGLVDLGESTLTQEEAARQLSTLMPTVSTTKQETKTSILGSLFKKAESADSTDSSTPSPDSMKTKPEKPKPGELRKNGLAELSPDRLRKFRETIANAIAIGNVSLDRALISIFRDNVPHLDPQQYMLLSTGWELACEEYFVNGVPPAWIIVLLGNALVGTALVEASKPKVEQLETDVKGRAIVNPDSGRQQTNL